MQFRPEVTVIRLRALAPSDAERLAGEAAGPEGLVLRPAGEPGGVGESADAREEVALGVAADIGGGNRSDVPVIDVAGRDLPGPDQVAQPVA